MEVTLFLIFLVFTFFLGAFVLGDSLFLLVFILKILSSIRYLSLRVEFFIIFFCWVVFLLLFTVLGWFGLVTFLFLKPSLLFLFLRVLFFFVSVSFIFLKCWVVGGIFFWLFLSEGVFSLKFTDLLVGLALMVTGVLGYFILS